MIEGKWGMGLLETIVEGIKNSGSFGSGLFLRQILFIVARMMH